MSNTKRSIWTIRLKSLLIPLIGYLPKPIPKQPRIRYIAERWQMDYNHYRPHSSLGYMTPTEYAKLCEDIGCVKQRKHKTGRVESCETLSQELD